MNHTHAVVCFVLRGVVYTTVTTHTVFHNFVNQVQMCYNIDTVNVNPMPKEVYVRNKRTIGNPVTLYNACKQWVRDEAESFAEPATLAQVWHKAVQQDENGRTFRKYVLRNYELA